MTWFNGKSIVVPIDHSEESIAAIKFAEQMSEGANAIHAIHVIPPISDPSAPLFDTTWTVLDDQFRTQAKENFEAWMRDNQTGDTTTTLVTIGDPGFMIVDYATEFKDSMIVVPSHGRTGIDRVLMGSVAERVVRHAHCPVLVLKLGDSKGKDFEFDPVPVIVPFDFSDDSVAAVKTAKQFVSDDRDLHVLHVIEDKMFAKSRVDDSEIRDAMRKRLEGIVDNAEFVTEHDDPGHATVERVEKVRAGLIVISSHGRTGLSRLLMGSVAERVVRHAQCPVLVLKSETARTQRLSDRPKREETDIDHRDDLLTVYTTDDPNYAEILRNALNDNEIKCEIDGEHQAGFAGLTSMPIKLLVRVRDFDRARNFIETHHPQ